MRFPCNLVLVGMGLGIRTRGKAGKFASAEQLGPELWPAWTSGLITVSGTGITVDVNGAHFAAASNIAHFQRATAGIEDNATYKVSYTISNFASANGGLEAKIYGTTTNHLGSGPIHNANGTYVFYVSTTTTGTVLNTARFRCTGTTGNNSFDVTAVSVRKVL